MIQLLQPELQVEIQYKYMAPDQPQMQQFLSKNNILLQNKATKLFEKGN